MKNFKRVIAGAMALLSAVSVASCGSSSGGDSSSSYVDKVKVASTEDIAAIPDGSEKELEWLSYFDINPTKKEPEKRTDLTLFEEKGGKIKYSQTSSMNKYDKLAARLMSNNPPDMFWYEQSMTFPANCIKEMFQPVDDIVDFDSAMWSDVKDVAEQFTLNGKHFVAPINFLPGSVITYDADKDEYVSNLNDADFVRASDMLYDIAKNGMYYPDWVGQAGDAFKKNILFYAMGPWASTGTHSPKDGDNWGVVPMPKDPNSDKLYTTIDMNAYMWVKGSTKNDAMKCWLECAKIVYTQDTYKDIEKEKFFVNNPNWTEDMYNVAYVDLVTDKFTKIFDPGYGISTTLSDNDAATNDTKEAVIPYLYTSVMKTDENGSQYTWTQLKEQYKGTVDSELKTLNDQYHAYLEKNK